MLMSRFSLPEGWEILRAPLLEKIKAYEVDGGKVSQVKEKYGELRIYSIDSIDSDPLDVYDEEVAASKLCMKCGKPATKFVTVGWIGPRCEEHI